MFNSGSLFSTKLTTVQRVDKAVTQLMGHERYTVISGVFMLGEREVVDDIATAATNGRDEYYGKKFVDEVLVRDSDVRFVVLHEVMHKVRRHLLNFQWMYDLDADIANRACDHVINLGIIRENADGFATMPEIDGKPIGLCDPRFIGMDEAQVFHILYEEKQKRGGSGDQGKGSMDHHDWAGAKEMTTEEVKQLGRDIDEALRQGAINASKLGHGNSSINISDLLAVEIDYRDVLREFFVTVCQGDDDATWRSPSRKHMAAGMLRPSRFSECMDEIVFAIDASGSTFTQNQLTKFMSELVGLLEAVSVKVVRLIYWDTAITGVEVYGENATPLTELVSVTKPVGGGGTDVNCVTKYLKDNNIAAQAVVVLTDGHLGNGWGNWDTEVLWCVLNNKKARPTTGKTVHINLN